MLVSYTHRVWFWKGVDNDDAVDDLQDPVVGALGVKNIESIVGCESNQAVGQNVPVSYSHPRYLK